jgi:RNA-directed DNA polymerase
MSRVPEPELQGKSYDIPKRLVWDAWLKVKSKGGAAGADGVTVERFEEGLQDNLFRLWNRMVSGSYFPGPVRAVEIPKQGGTRRLGIPNVVDRIAQTAAALALEANVEAVFHDDSYGYRPGRSPLDAVAVCRERCFKRDWVVDLDIRSFFDSVPWELMLRALARHTDQKWVLLYVERWLEAPMLMPDGSIVARVKGTPQGSPISPLLANVFLHYGLDLWMVREFPSVPFERFADDAVLHCVSEKQAEHVRACVARRMVEVGLELNPDKTRIVYCKDTKRRGNYERVSFTFCGYTFRPRKAYNKRTGDVFTGFLPAASAGKLTEMSRKAAAWRVHRRTTLTLNDLADEMNPVLRGWFNYYAALYPTAVIPLCRRIDSHLMRWARWKYKRLEPSDRRARAWLHGVSSREPELFAHWRHCAP